MNTTRWRLPRPATLVLAAGLVSGAAFAVATGISSASTTATTTAATATTMPGDGPWGGPFGPGGAGGGPFGPGGAWGGPGGAWGGPFGPGGAWGGSAPASSGRAEYFHVASTNQAGPGAIIVTGVFNDGGVEHPSRTVDSAVFGDGTFRIDHSSGQPTTRFNARTCVGTITQTGPFRVYDGTGRFSGLGGSGTYWFYATYTTGRNAAGCTKTVTAYIETIDGAITVST
jgi:hypothetical protein